ncbi:EI24 domain-containing protein [Sulfurovum sp.]|uniref:EI24 domain-containing protein n=1 Tax=Sulfurovum sp. TaxID=1969726 RepID=UPI0025EACE2E|nr:EI24 domain-containing protein [Sulfurovum sp.]
MTQAISKSFKDIFSGTVLLFVTKVTLIALAITAAILWLVGRGINSFIAGYLSWLPWEWLQTTGASVASIAISYMIFIIMISVLTSFMIEPLLISLARKHYPETKVVGAPNITTSLLLSLKSAIMMFILFIFTFPIMFIPLVGAVYILWLWSILLKKPTIYDVSSLFIADKKEVKSRTKKSTMLAMIAAGFNYIPLLNIFSAVFAQILFLHYILGKEEN